MSSQPSSDNLVVRPFDLSTTVAILLLVVPLVWGTPTAARAMKDGQGVELTGSLPMFMSPDTIGLRPFGMGGAGVALSSGIEGNYLNPAGLWRRRGAYVLEAAYVFHPKADYHSVSVGVHDSRSNARIAGGVAYSNYEMPRNPAGTSISGDIIRLSASLPLAASILTGVTIKYITLAHPGVEIQRITADVGAQLILGKYFALGVVGHNLIYTETAEVPIGLTVGIGLCELKGFSAVFDWVIDFASKDQASFEYRFGAEYAFLKMFAVRAGFVLDKIRDKKFLTFGLEWKSKRAALVAAFRKELGELSTNRYIGIALQVLP